MSTEKDIKILQWPKQKALLEHYFQLDKPCPVSIIFEDKPAHVHVTNDEKRPLNVNMNMNLKAVDTIPVCIKICDPICAVSDYTIGVELLGQPLASIRLKGKTKIAHCRNENPLPTRCIDFVQQNPKGGPSPITIDGVQFNFLDDGGQIRFTTMGQPINQLKMSIPDQGLRIDFPFAVKKVELTIVNFGNPVIQLNAFNNSNIVVSQSELIDNATSTVDLNGALMTAIEIKGGSNEAALVDICYDRASIDEQDTTVIIQ